MKKSAKIISILFLSLIFAAGIFLYLNFSNLAKNAAEKIASNALGVNVSISSLDVSLKDKKATLSGIRISNPAGFKKRHIITANNINIGLKAASRQLIDFNDVQVNGTVINLEVTPNGTNLQALKNLAARKKQKEAVGSEQVRVIVRKMVINESTLNPSITLLNRDLGSINLPAVRVSGIGSQSNGAVAQDALSQIMVQYLKVAEREARKAGVLAGVEGALNDAKSQVQDAVDDAVNEATKSLNKLFN